MNKMLFTKIQMAYEQHKKRHENLAKIVADLREALDERDMAIKDLENALAESRQSRARLTEQFLEYKHNSIRIPNIHFEVYSRRK